MSAYVRAKEAYLREMSARYPAHLVPIPRSEWPTAREWASLPVEVWRSRQFLVMLYDQDGYERLSVCRAALAPGGADWAEGISWEDLQQVKAECGRWDCWVVEVFPPDAQIVNVANMRHLWILKEPPPYGWKEEES